MISQIVNIALIHTNSFNTALRKMEESVDVILQHKLAQRKKGNI